VKHTQKTKRRSDEKKKKKKNEKKKKKKKKKKQLAIDENSVKRTGVVKAEHENTHLFVAKDLGKCFAHFVVCAFEIGSVFC
jgi:hypothetical protein